MSALSVSGFFVFIHQIFEKLCYATGQLDTVACVYRRLVLKRCPVARQTQVHVLALWVSFVSSGHNPVVYFSFKPPAFLSQHPKWIALNLTSVQPDVKNQRLGLTNPDTEQ